MMVYSEGRVHYSERVAVVTRDCLIKWMNDGTNIEMTAGHSVDEPVGAFRAFSKCGSEERYTMGFNEYTKRQSFIDLWQFLHRTWQLDGPAEPLT